MPGYKFYVIIVNNILLNIVNIVSCMTLLLFAWSIIYDHLNKGKTQGGAAKEAFGEGFGNGAAGPLGSLMEGLGKLPWPHIGLPCLCPANKKSGAATGRE